MNATTPQNGPFDLRGVDWVDCAAARYTTKVTDQFRSHIDTTPSRSHHSCAGSLLTLKDVHSPLTSKGVLDVGCAGAGPGFAVIIECVDQVVTGEREGR